MPTIFSRDNQHTIFKSEPAKVGTNLRETSCFVQNMNRERHAAILVCCIRHHARRNVIRRAFALVDISTMSIGKSKCDFLVLSGDKWREKKFLLSDKSA